MRACARCAAAAVGRMAARCFLARACCAGRCCLRAPGALAGAVRLLRTCVAGDRAARALALPHPACGLVGARVLGGVPGGVFAARSFLRCSSRPLDPPGRPCRAWRTHCPPPGGGPAGRCALSACSPRPRRSPWSGGSASPSGGCPAMRFLPCGPEDTRPVLPPRRRGYSFFSAPPVSRARSAAQPRLAGGVLTSLGNAHRETRVRVCVCLCLALLLGVWVSVRK